MTGIVHHSSQRITWGQTRHSYLVDIGDDIEIQQVEVSNLFENRMIDPPYPRTRYFEIEIDELRSTGGKSGAFRNIYPVRAHRKPDWHILRFRIRRGSWTITERMTAIVSAGNEIQWLYTDDFNLLFLASGGRYDAESLIGLVTGKLDTIVRSIRSGSRIPSELENQQSCRDVLDTMFAGGINCAFQDTVLYRHHADDFPAGSAAGDELPSQTGIAARHGKAAIPPGGTAGIHVDVSQIEDLRDTSWLDD